MPMMWRTFDCTASKGTRREAAAAIHPYRGSHIPCNLEEEGRFRDLCSTEEGFDSVENFEVTAGFGVHLGGMICPRQVIADGESQEVPESVRLPEAVRRDDTIGDFPVGPDGGTKRQRGIVASSKHVAGK